MIAKLVTYGLQSWASKVFYDLAREVDWYKVHLHITLQWTCAYTQCNSVMCVPCSQTQSQASNCTYPAHDLYLGLSTLFFFLVPLFYSLIPVIIPYYSCIILFSKVVRHEIKKLNGMVWFLGDCTYSQPWAPVLTLFLPFRWLWIGNYSCISSAFSLMSMA